MNILQILWQDFLNFLAVLTGRSYVAANTIGIAPVALKPTITEDQAITQALATETKLNPRDLGSWYHIGNPEWHREIDTFTIFAGWNPGATCGGVSSPGLNLSQAAGIAESAGSQIGSAVGGTVGSVVGEAIPGVNIVLGIVNAIRAHHLANVVRDNRAECILIPFVNNAFQVLITGVQNGQIKPADAYVGLGAIPQQFLATAGPAKNNSPFCNALCEYLIRVRAIVFYWQSQFKAME